jgi:hypothetical protein
VFHHLLFQLLDGLRDVLLAHLLHLRALHRGVMPMAKL